MARIAQELTALATTSPARLREEWVSTFGEEVPDLPVSMIRRVIGYRMQETAFGGLPAHAQRMLDIMAESGTDHRDTPIQLKPGSRLLREWNGKLHTVIVEEGGFRFGGRRFASLSHIAREITGAHWSGPRFFGLKQRPAPPSRGVSDNG